jgi:hypothetical protein
MANNLTGPVWVLDTVGTISAAVLRIERIAWKNATTLNHTVKVTDLAGGVIFEDFAAGVTYNVSEPIHREVNGLIVEALESGKLYVSVAQRPRSF